MSNQITVNVNGKDYIVCPSRAYRVMSGEIKVVYTYWSTRNGAAFGPMRFASRGKGKGVGTKLVALADEAFGTDYEALKADVLAKEAARA